MGIPARRLQLTLAASLAVSVAILALLPTNALWITDCSNKYLTSVNIVSSHFTDPSIRYPGAALDPAFAANPIVEPFSVVRGDKLYSQYPPLFAYLTACFCALFGWYGAFVLPLAGALLSLWLLHGLARDAGLSDGHATACAATFYWCTPCLFYAFCLWEHTIAIAIVLACLRLLARAATTNSRASFIVAGAALGFGVGFREEFYLLAGALFVALLLDRVTRKPAALRFPLGVVLGLIPIWLFQRWAVGTAFGFHMSQNLKTSVGWSAGGLAGLIAERWHVTAQLLGNISASHAVTIAASLSVIAACVYAARQTTPAEGPPTLIYAWVASLAALSGIVFVAAGNPIEAWMNGNGLLMHAAILLPAACGFVYSGTGATPTIFRLLRNAALLFVALLCLAAPPISAQGIHWGPRLMLPVFPMLLVPAWAAAQKASGGRGLKAVIAAAVIACGLVQLYSLGILRQKLQATARIEQALLAAPEDVIVTNIWWFPQEMAPIFYKKKFFAVFDEETMAKLSDSMRQGGESGFLLVTGMDNGPDQAPAFVLKSPLHHFDVAVYRYRLNR